MDPSRVYSGNVRRVVAAVICLGLLIALFVWTSDNKPRCPFDGAAQAYDC